MRQPAMLPEERTRRQDEMPVMPVSVAPTAPPLPVAAVPLEARWPMPVAEFLAGPWLEPADVLLMRKRRSFFAWAIRALTSGYFSKAALVFLVPHRDHDFEKPFVIAAGFGGVDLADLPSYLSLRSSKGRWVVAVKRLEVQWFDAGPRAHVRGLMLAQLQARYDYKRLFWNLATALGRSGFLLLRLLVGTRRALISLRGASRRSKLDRVIGPGFIQWSYYVSTAELIESGAAPASALADVTLLREGRGYKHKPSEAADPPDEEDLFSVTADDLAASSRLAWKFAIVDGFAHRVGTEAEFRSVIAAAGDSRRRETGDGTP